VPTLERQRLRPSFLAGAPLASVALGFAVDRHAGQLREGDRAPYVLHPLEVGFLLRSAGYPDHVVAAGVLHDVLEQTDADQAELYKRFGSRVARIVEVVSEDASILDERARKAALRAQVAGGPLEAGAVFAADKVSKARELRMKLSSGPGGDEIEHRLEHYRASLWMLEPMLGARDVLWSQLRFELETLDALPPA
jgi:(p)ppGpp synthase/HD superfamily hydrolase